MGLTPYSLARAKAMNMAIGKNPDPEEMNQEYTKLSSGIGF
jgi:hypothetical protein